MSANQPTPVLPRNVLIQIYTRFLLNLPDSLKTECSKNFVRLFFELERAHWFYLDHYIEDQSIGGVDMFGFAAQLFKEFPEIVPPGVVWQDKYFEWRKYRGETETGSAIILDEYFEMILLVQGFYGNRWSFPGGKVNENESLIECAGREVLEETGLDVVHRLQPSLFIDRMLGGTLRRAFIVENMPRISRLQPGTRNEIEAITWFNVQDLPICTQDTRPMEKLAMRPNNFYLVMPYMRQLREYIRLRSTGLSPISALEKSKQLIDLALGSSVGPQTQDKHTLPTNVPWISRPLGKLHRREHQNHDQLLHSKGAATRDEEMFSLHSAVDLEEFRKDLILLNVPSLESASSYEIDNGFSSCWSNVQLRSDVLLDLLIRL